MFRVKSNGSIGSRVKEVRQELKMSQATLGKSCGLAQATVSGLEQDKSHTSSQLWAIAKTLGVRAEWLQSGEEPKYLDPAHRETLTDEDREILALVRCLTSKQKSALKAQLQDTKQENLEALAALTAIKGKLSPKSLREPQT
jgi:transcriptional regulator with XRE-family HTH domain